MKIAVVGSINIDQSVETDRIPRKGETIAGQSLQYTPGGKGANQAVAMGRLGAEVVFFGCVGDDANGKAMLENLGSQGVSTTHIQTIENVPTGIALITVGDDDNTIIIVSGANHYVDKPYIDKIKHYLTEFDLVVLQNEIPKETNLYVIDFCNQNHIPVLFNPAPIEGVDMDIIEKVTYFTPNEHEAELLFQTNDYEELVKKYPEKLLITMGEKGVLVQLNDGETLTVPARKTKVVDTTGAGDTLNGAFAMQIAGGASVKDALQFANVAASLSIEKFGAQGGMPTYEEVVNALMK